MIYMVNQFQTQYQHKYQHEIQLYTVHPTSCSNPSSHQYSKPTTFQPAMTSRNNTSRNYDNNAPPIMRAPNSQSHPPSRRTLFSSHPRRPAAASSVSTATSSGSQNVHSDASATAKEDIIIRDETGDFRLELPTQGPLSMREDQKEDQSNITSESWSHGWAFLCEPC